MKCYAVIDTNVLVSAAIKPDSVPGTIFRLILIEQICPVFNSEILEEYKRVLPRRYDRVLFIVIYAPRSYIAVRDL